MLYCPVGNMHVVVGTLNPCAVSCETNATSAAALAGIASGNAAQK